MEQLPNQIRLQYEALSRAFGDRDPTRFSWAEAVSALSAPEGTTADILSRLERSGYLVKEVDMIDQRMRHYRLIEVERALELEEKLEAWRQVAGQRAPALPHAIDRFWALCRRKIKDTIDLSATPEQPGQLVLERAKGKIGPSELRIVKMVELDRVGGSDQDHAKEVLKLFDASSNAYRSVTNVLLEYERLRRDLAGGEYDLRIAECAAVDGEFLEHPKPVPNKSLCPICRRFRQSKTALALITGNPKMDSVFQTHRAGQSTRASMRVCSYCFTAGWVDLPTALIVKAGQSVSKGREYLFITTPLTREELKRLLDIISKRDLESDASGNGEEESEEKATAAAHGAGSDAEIPARHTDGSLDQGKRDSLSAFTRLLKDKYGIEGFDRLSVLGLSSRRLKELRGFVLPSANPLQRIVALRVPVERLIGEEKVSGAVQRELVKATMYDFWRITGGTLHYGRILNSASFSIEGEPIEHEAMRRANMAYHIADRYARTGRYGQISSGILLLLLSHPRQAANRILRAKHRIRRYAPGQEKVREVIELTESIAQQDWKFDLGLRIVGTLVDVGLLKKAKSFRFGPGPNDVFTSVDLVKWLQRLKMIRDETSARAWGNMLLNALKRGDRAYKGYIEAQGGQISAPGKEVVGKILDLVEGDNGIIQTCARNHGKLSELARDLANMDYYLLFYHNQRQAATQEEEEDPK